MNKDTLIELFHHMEAADARVWSAILSNDAAKSDSKIRDNVYHIHTTQRAFLRLWLGEPPLAPFPVFDTTAAMLPWATTCSRDALAFLSTQDQASLEAPLILPWADLVEQKLGTRPGPTNVKETALQVLLHTAHHRGQVNARLRELGAEPPMVDYIAWLWMGRPSAAWPDA
jgi:uncharacterized damage-inducible protein DinB